MNTPDSPRVYRANMKFEEAGNWVLHVQLDSPSHGQADFRVPIVVLPTPIEPGAEGGWVFLGSLHSALSWRAVHCQIYQEGPSVSAAGASVISTI